MTVFRHGLISNPETGLVVLFHPFIFFFCFFSYLIFALRLSYQHKTFPTELIVWPSSMKQTLKLKKSFSLVIVPTEGIVAS